MKKVVLSVVLSIYSIIVFSQTECINAERKIQFGYDLGVNYSMLQTKEPLPQGTSILNGVGFKLGLFIDYSLSESFIFSPKTELTFYNSQLRSLTNDNSINTDKVYPKTAEIMTHLKYKVKKGKNNPYLLAGPNFKVSHNLNSNSSTEFTNRSDFAVDFGLGLEHLFQYFV